MSDVSENKRQIMAAYSKYYCDLNSDNVDDLFDLVTDDFEFTDPFTTKHGPKNVCAYLSKTFSETKNPNFVVTHQALDGDLGFLRWRFSAKLKVIGLWEFTGMTALTFNEDGTKIASHVDHWDASQNFYAKIPVLGCIIRLLARRVAAV